MPDTSQTAAWAAALQNCPTAVISDNLDRLPGAIGLRPYHKISGIMAGPAFTIRVTAGDNLMIHQALEQVEPGQVIVVDGDGELSRALVGEIMVAVARSKKAAGFVIDGAIRDSAIIAAGDFPVFARGVIHRGPWKNGPGQINVPVSVGGMVVSPGDFVVGDHDGVVAFGPDKADFLIEAVRAQEAKEAEILARIAAGTYGGDYGKK